MEAERIAATAAASRRPGERGTVLVVALFVLILLFVLGMSILTMSVAEGGIASNDVSTEGAFYAAEAGVQSAIAQVGANPTTSIQAIPLSTLSNGYSFRSGRKTDSSAQPLVYVGAVQVSGFAIGSGSGYGTSGFVNHVYRVNATGTGPRNAQREIEIQVEYGPVLR